MRDIKSLQPKELIAIQTKKQAKKLSKKTGLDLVPGNMLGLSDEKGFYYTGTCRHDKGWSLLDASDFLPKKKKNKKLKDVFKELANFDNRLADIESKLSQKEQISDLVTTDPANLDVKGSEVVSGCLQERKWYKHNAGGFLFYKQNLEEYCVFYGFDSYLNWIDEVKYGTTIANYLLPATDEEVKEALVKEAERRGYANNHINLLTNGYKSEKKLTDKFEFKKNELLGYSTEKRIYTIMKDGIWAEIVSQPEDSNVADKGMISANNEGEIDWDKPLQIVQSGSFLVITTGKHTENCFTGLRIDSNKTVDMRRFRNDLSKIGFNLYTGEPITLINENIQ